MATLVSPEWVTSSELLDRGSKREFETKDLVSQATAFLMTLQYMGMLAFSAPTSWKLARLSMRMYKKVNKEQMCFKWVTKYFKTCP